MFGGSTGNGKNAAQNNQVQGGWVQQDQQEIKASWNESRVSERNEDKPAIQIEGEDARISLVSPVIKQQNKTNKMIT